MSIEYEYTICHYKTERTVLLIKYTLIEWSSIHTNSFPGLTTFSAVIMDPFPGIFRSDQPSEKQPCGKSKIWNPYGLQRGTLGKENATTFDCPWNNVYLLARHMQFPAKVLCSVQNDQTSEACTKVLQDLNFVHRPAAGTALQFCTLH